MNKRGSRITGDIKRLIDILISGTALVCLAPIMAVTTCLIWLSMGSPAIFRQRRAGFLGRPFDMKKFRTMTEERDDNGKLLPDSQRLTRLGLFLRRTSIDELPQFWSVLKGDMTIIGPRPLPLKYLSLYTREQSRRHTVPQGMFGWATVRGRNTNSWERKFELDLWYVDNWSLWLDIRILFMAVATVLSGQGVNEDGCATSSSFTGSQGQDQPNRRMLGPEIIMEDARFIFRLADPALEGERIHSFRKEAFARDFDLDHFKWFYLNYPYSHNRVYIAEEKSTGRIASAITMLPFRYRVGSVTEDVSLATGGATHPNFRGFGLFTRISNMLVEQESKRGIRCGLGFPNPDALTCHIKAGWQVPFELTFLEKRDIRSGNVSLGPIERFDERYNELYKEAAELFDFVNLKDAKILNWRYIDRPDVKYHCFEINRPRLDGFIVLKEFQGQGIRKTHIVDFLALNEHAADTLISAAENFSKGTDLLNLWMPPAGPYAKIFIERGFKSTEERAPMIFQRQGITEPNPFSSPWIVLGDNDVY
jgi:lipopolysaccharide/colanic/teichoic acid biosynthesis glycosyltransferase/GNAT superfamily N-acetyltransferase